MLVCSRLKGFSGCSLTKHEKDGEYFVRKVSKDIQYNQRFAVQLKKQMYFRKISETLNLQEKTPIIISRFYTDDNLLACDMEFIEGTTVSESLSRFDENKKESVINDIFSFIKKEVDVATYERPTQPFSAVLQDKVNSLLLACRFDINLEKKIENATNQVTTKLDLTPTFCHGDFTLENMIFSDGTIYFIDFLDSFFPHYWFDISKLYQELEAAWQYIKSNSSEPEIRPEYTLKRGLDKLLIEHFQEYAQYHYYFLALTLARIIPYSTNKEIAARLIIKIEKYISNFLNQVKLGEVV